MASDDDPTPRDGTELVTRDSESACEQSCLVCGSPRAGTDRYCESDGYDFESRSRWIAVIAADRTYFEQVASDGIAFPGAYRPRTFPLDADEVSIGRHSATRGINPDIDLAGTPEDPGISHFHALLVRGPQGRYAVVDAGSTNGTIVNDAVSCVPDVEVPLTDGDEVHLGAWTTITIRELPHGD
jgi:pSer/pThr/pTyr-binding forkhead associated (FHA) protein